MNINTNFHTLSGTNISEINQDKVYQEYRKKWHNNPKNFSVEDFPLFLDIEATNNCNLKCPHCWQSNSKFEKGYMNWFVYERIIDEAVSEGCYGCKYHTINRGEPLLNANMAMMIAYAKKKGLIDVYLNTNATLLTKEYSQRLLDSGLDRISFSIDGLGSAYEINRPGANFNKVFNNIMYFCQLRDEGGYNNTHIRVQSVKLKELNMDEYTNFWNWNCFPDEVAFLDFKDMDKRCNQLATEWICPQPWQRMSILWDGTILPCNHDDRQWAKLGIFPEMSIKKAWHSVWMKYIRENQVKGFGELIGACNGCYLRTSEAMKLN